MRRVTLEVSLKPFHDLRDDAVRDVCREIFRQWDALHRHADEIAVLIWAADGSEILDYTGRPDDTFEWANVIGIANPRGNVPNDPDGQCLHSRPYPYRDDAPTFTYRDFGRVVAALREVGQAMTGKRVEVGATFDPGGEFARSSFKYERHPEICMANTMGHKTFVCCYATLNADTHAYATFPDGIPAGTSLGTFLGRQARAFMADLGFDYIWLSNGFGFGLETWKSTGPMFNGLQFESAAAPDIRGKNLAFWRDFRRELGEFPVEVRGTNLGTGADLATDAVPLREIMEGGFGIRCTAPNSPWAAINGDFGVEMVGYMSRIAQPVAGQHFLYRYYVHDPWWLNSPWLDRYGRNPHDIYLPLAVGRVDESGRTHAPDDVALLTIDDSYGRMPVECPNEVTPHLLRAMSTAPDAPGLVTWVYPYDTFHDWALEQPNRLPEAFFHDWFIRSAVNNSFPVNTVISDRSVAKLPGNLPNTILFSRVPDAGSDVEAALLRHIRAGGRTLLFGPTAKAGEELLRHLGVSHAEPVEGTLELRREAPVDEPAGVAQIVHRPLMSAGPIDTVLRAGEQGVRVLATAGGRVVATVRGPLAWVRGTLTSSFATAEGPMEMDDPTRFAAGDVLLRDALAALGVFVCPVRREPQQRPPVLAVSRHRGALWLAGFMPDTTVALDLGSDDGIPLPVGCDVEITRGRGRYRFPIAFRHECRVLIEQADGVVQCREGVSVAIGVSRRLTLGGLKDATVRFLPEPGSEPRVTFQPSPTYPYLKGPFAIATEEDRFVGRCLTVRGISGTLLISW